MIVDRVVSFLGFSFSFSLVAVSRFVLFLCCLLFLLIMLLFCLSFGLAFGPVCGSWACLVFLL